MQTNEVAQVIIKGKYITEKFSNQDVVPDDAEIMYEIRLNKFIKVNSFSLNRLKSLSCIFH